MHLIKMKEYMVENLHSKKFESSVNLLKKNLINPIFGLFVAMISNSG